jgi:hypothetical protein
MSHDRLNEQETRCDYSLPDLAAKRPTMRGGKSLGSEVLAFVPDVFEFLFGDDL